MPDAIDPSRIESWFGELHIDFAGRLQFDRIGLGQSNLTYLVSDESQGRWVLRRPPLGHLLASAHDVVREARIMAALADTDVPVPRILGVARDGAVQGDAESDVPLVLMEFIDGQVVDTMAIAQSLSPQRRREISDSMPRTLARIHAVDLERVGLADLASHKPYAQRQLKRWAGQWEQSKTREVPDLDDLTRRLVAAIPEQTELSLVHGDFHVRNVIVSRQDGSVIGVLDWELSTLGDPLADMGSMLAYWAEPGETGFAALFPTALDGFCTRDEIAQIYLAETGRDPQALKYWHTLGLWKLAVIAEGVMRRAMDTPANRAAAGTPTVERVDQVVQMARAVADDAGI